MTNQGTSVRGLCAVSALCVGLLTACQQGATPEAQLSVRRSNLIGVPEPGATVVLDFSTDAAGNSLSRGTVLGEQFAAAGIHFSGGYILGDRTVDFASYLNTPSPDILICTPQGEDPGGCGAPQDRPAAGTALGINFDFPVCYASIVGRTQLNVMTGRIGMAGFDAGGFQTGTGASRDILPTLVFPSVIDPVTFLPKVGEGTGTASMPYLNAVVTPFPYAGLDVHRMTIYETALSSFDDLTIVRCTGLQPKCKNQIVCTSAAQGCMIATPVNVDNGSYNASNDQPVTVSQSPGPPYPLGTTGVTVSVTQGAATATCIAGVFVGDCSAPTIICPPPVTLGCAPQGAFCTPYGGQATASDTCQTQAIPSSACLAVGINNVRFDATSINGTLSSCTTAVTVVDSQPPVVTGPGIEIDSVPALSPVDGELHAVDLNECDVSVSDVCDNQVSKDGPGTKITCVSSNEDGLCVPSSDDVQLVDGGEQVRLRAKNNADGTNRVYTVHFESKDSSGNTSSGDCYFAVPGGGGQGGGGDAGAGGGAGGSGGASGTGGGGAAGATTPDGGATGGIGGGGGAPCGAGCPDAGSPDASDGGGGQGGGAAGTGGRSFPHDASASGGDAGGDGPPPRRDHGCSAAGDTSPGSVWFMFAVGAALALRNGHRRRR